MLAITLDPELRARLNGLTEHLEVRDEHGTTVGHFVPDEQYRELLYAWARAKFADPAEFERARREYQSEGGLSTPEAVAHLEQVAREAHDP